jgi:uncharacterized protein YlxW (UPF0749 family)
MENRGGQSLLDHIAATALDDDYYVHRPVGQQRGPLAGAARSLALVLVLVGVGVVAAPAAMQVRTERAAAELERRTLIDAVADAQDIENRNRAIRDQLRADVSAREGSQGGRPADTEGLAVLAGSVPVHGPGLSMLITHGRGAEGRVTDADLQILANGLWHAGAEAVSIDGQRLGSLTPIRAAGDAITVNYRSIRPPYVVLALGEPEELSARFGQSPVGRYWEGRHRNAQVGLDMTGLPDVVIPAVPPRRLTVSHAQVLAEGVDQR